MRDEERSVGRKKLGRKAELPSKRGIRWPRWTGFRGMTVRDWLQLLIVPLALVIIGFLFTAQQDQRQQQTENQRAQAERELAEQRAQDEALQAYLDQMSGLLLERHLRASELDSEVRTLARARTLTVLEKLDSSHKTQVVRFLIEAKLVGGSVEGTRTTLKITVPVISLTRANLQGTDVSEQGVRLIDPSGSFVVTNLEAADLAHANLEGANLKATNLKGANLEGANLGDANLEGANLDFANLNFANLEDANLKDANFGGYPHADFSLANLKGANLKDVEGVTNEELVQEAETLEGATMPNGQKYEDWLKSRGEENSGSS